MKKAIIAAFLILAAVSAGSFDGSRIIIAGSSCMGRMMTELTRGYCRQSGITAQAQLGGTQLGLIALKSGACDIASVSRPLTDLEKAWAEEYPIAIDVIAVIVHPNNSVDELTLSQIRDIYSEKITDWSELGGEKMPIVVIGREAGSGTRFAFEQNIGIERACHDQEHSETGMLRTAVSMTRGAIGYISFDFITDDIKALAIDNVTACEETALSGEYPITRQFLLCVRKGEKNAEITDFLSYCIGKKGKAVIKNLGMVPFRGEYSYAA